MPPGLIALALAIPASGLVALELLGCRPRSELTRVGLAIGVGMTLTILALYAPLALTGQVHFGPAFVLLGAGLAGGLVHVIRHGRDLRSACCRPAVIVCALALVLLIQTVAAAPFRGYDAKAIYGIKAKALLHERDVAGPLFQDRDVVHYHGDYPLGIPLLMALSGRVSEPSLGAADDSERARSVESYAVLASLWIVALVALIVGRIRRFTDSPTAVAALTVCAVPVWMAMPWVGGRSWSWAGADLPVCVLIGTAAVVILELRQRRPGRWLSILALGMLGGVLLKNDVLLPAIALAIACVPCLPRARRWPVVAAIVAGLLVGLGLVVALRARTIGAPFDESYLAALGHIDPGLVLARVPVLIRACFVVLTGQQLAASWAFVVLLAVPFAILRGGVQRLLAVWIAVDVVLIAGVFLITPDHLVWHLDTALGRLLGHVGLVGSLLMVGVLARVWKVAAPTSRALAQLPPPR